MKISNDMTIQLLNKALDASVKRQGAISNNIANVNTQNYKANRVIFEEELKKAILPKNNAGLMTTKSKHMSLSQGIRDIKPRVVKDTHTTMGLDGNNVDIDVENANLAANQLLYNALVTQINNKYRVLQHVISEGKK
ncbi:MAG: flagellar basal body rod protein FlgB [Peptostreptococcales bacterium]